MIVEEEKSRSEAVAADDQIKLHIASLVGRAPAQHYFDDGNGGEDDYNSISSISMQDQPLLPKSCSENVVPGALNGIQGQSNRQQKDNVGDSWSE